MLIRADELNVLKSDLERNWDDIDAAIEVALDWLLLAYADGKSDTEVQLNGHTEVGIDHVIGVISEEIGGKNVFERINEYVELNEVEDLVMMLGNERQRVYNTASFETATELGAKTKTWHTMEDNRVRDSHFYLDKVTKPINEEFHTIWGNSGQHPGGFNAPDDDINCRCYLTFT